MPPELSDYKEMVDGLTEGGFTDPQTRALVEFVERVVSGLRDEMREGFRAVNERFDKVDERFDKVDERFDRTDGRLDSLYDRIDSVKNWLIGGLSALILTLISALVALAVNL